jgi:hypothetical protein
MNEETITSQDVKEIKACLNRIARAVEAMAKKADPSFKQLMPENVEALLKKAGVINE